MSPSATLPGTMKPPAPTTLRMAPNKADCDYEFDKEDFKTWHCLLDLYDLEAMRAVSRMHDGIVLGLYILATGVDEELAHALGARLCAITG